MESVSVSNGICVYIRMLTIYMVLGARPSGHILPMLTIKSEEKQCHARYHETCQFGLNMV